MIILIIAEPRSGSTNFTNWFFYNKKFTTLFNPSILTSKWYQNGISPKDYKYQTEHLVIKEDFFPDKSYDNFLDIADKIILLYRENETEQIQSWITAITTNNWDRQYRYKQIKNEEQEIYFKSLKSGFKKFLINDKYFSISYESLYYRDGIKSIIDYIGIDELNGFKFPLGNKYRIDVSTTKNII